MSELKNRVTGAMKEAMRARAKERLGTLRLMLAAMNQREIDDRVTLEDDDVLVILEKMIKQRRESIQQYEAAARQDLADKERREVTVIEEFMPEALAEHEIDRLVAEAIAETGATSMREMGKVMGILKPKIQGRVDMSLVSSKVKESLT